MSFDTTGAKSQPVECDCKVTMVEARILQVDGRALLWKNTYCLADESSGLPWNSAAMANIVNHIQHGIHWLIMKGCTYFLKSNGSSWRGVLTFKSNCIWGKTNKKKFRSGRKSSIIPHQASTSSYQLACTKKDKTSAYNDTISPMLYTWIVYQVFYRI